MIPERPAEQGLCGLAGVVMAKHRMVPATGVLRHGRAAERTLMTS
jgi:hypothetical protein